jgi:two-component system response regulator YesN
MEGTRVFLLSEAESYLEECRAERRSVRASELARLVNRSPAQLAREFHLSVGSGIKDYLGARQVEFAKELLVRTCSTTAEIAVLAGFGTARTFYRAFRRTTGISPTEYRKEMSLARPEVRP